MNNISLDSTVKWFNKTEGRDKICKVIQYGSRLLMWHLKNKGEDKLSNQFKSLYANTRDARKLFRLAKFVNEFHTILSEFYNLDTDTLTKASNILTRVFFALYWYYDNLTVLNSIKFLSNDPKPYQLKAMRFWFAALIVSLIGLLRQFYILHHKTVELKKGKTQISQDTNNNDYQKTLSNLEKKRNGLILNLVKILGDLMPAGQGSEFLPKVLGINLNDGQIGFGGLVSGALAAYSAY